MSEYCGTGTGNFPQPGDPDLNGSVITAAPAFGGIDVSWTYPGLNPQAVAYTILYRSTNSDPTTAVQHRIVQGDYFYDRTSTATLITYYYWIRLVSVNGTEGDLLGPASAQARPTIEQTIEMLTGQIESGVLAQSLKDDLSRIDTNRQLIDQEALNRAQYDDSLAAAINELTAFTEDTDALIRQEMLARADADSAQVAQINTIAARADDNQAATQQEQTARISADDALANQITTVQSSLGDDIATVEQTLSTEVTRVDGTLQNHAGELDSLGLGQTDLNNGLGSLENEVSNIGALYTVQVGANDLVGGFGVYNDGTSVEAGFDVDRFWVGRTRPTDGTLQQVKPFIIENDEVFINEAVINKLTFNKLRSADGNLIVDSGTGKLKAQYLDAENLTVRQAQSTNYSAGVAGWKLSNDGSFEMVGSSTTGKVVQDADGTRIYDENGVLRVRMGRLS